MVPSLDRRPAKVDLYRRDRARYRRVASRWPSSNGHGKPFVVCTGGEPLLQLDAAAVAALHERGFEIAIETNGTLAVPPGVDWVCVSPKAGADLAYGIDTAEYRPQAAADALDRFGIDQDRPYVLFVGRVTRQKFAMNRTHSPPNRSPKKPAIALATGSGSVTTA